MINEERIFVLIDTLKLFFICRKTGQIFHRMDQRMEKFGQYDNKYLYTVVPLDPKYPSPNEFEDDEDHFESIVDFKILFYDISSKIFPLEIFANESNPSKFSCWCWDGRGSIVSAKEDKIIGIHCEVEFESYYLVSWNITSGKEIFRISMMDVFAHPPDARGYPGCKLNTYVRGGDYAFYIEFDYNGILKWPYVGFSTNGLCKPYMPFDGTTFIVDATTGNGELFGDDSYDAIYYDLKIQMDIAMIHFPKTYSYRWQKSEEQALRFCFVEWKNFLEFELEHKSLRSLFVKYPDHYSIIPFRSQIKFSNGRILIVLLKDKSGIYLAKLNFWS